MSVPVNSGFELVVVEGGGLGTVCALTTPHVTLGRHEPADEPSESLLVFPEPTVSRVHAVMSWDERKRRYVLEHRSRTNATVLNGTELTQPQPLQVGDRIKMGRLVLELRQSAAAAALPEAERYLVVLSGPDRGKVCALTHARMPLRTLEQARPDQPSVVVEGVQEWNLDFVYIEGRLYFECDERPGVVLQWPGLVYDRLVGSRERTELPEGSLLVCGDVGFVQADRRRALELSRRLEKGEALADRILDAVTPGKPPYWRGDEPFVLRVLSGCDRGSTLWIDPTRLRGPILLGRANGTAGLHVEIPDRDAAELTITFADDEIRLRNVDKRTNVNHNWEIFRPGDEAELVSGDRITLGRTMLSFEHVPVQSHLESWAVFHGDVEMPLVRAVNYIGYRPENELRIDDRRLGPRHGIVGVREGGIIYYRHLNPEGVVRIGDAEVAGGEERVLQPGDRLVLTDGIEVRLGERVSSHRPSDPILIGPTQKQIEAEMAARKKS